MIRQKSKVFYLCWSPLFYTLCRHLTQTYWLDFWTENVFK